MKTLMHRLTILLVCCFFLSACDEKMKEAQNTFNNFKNIAESAQNIQEEIRDQSEKLKERKERGDTVALHFEELSAYLPKDIDGYKLDGDLDGSTTKTPGLLSVSEVSQRYVNADGDRLEVKLVDYIGAFSVYTSMFSVYASGFEIDNSNEHLKGFTIDDDIKGWQVYKKKSKKAEINAGIGGRFVVTIKADNQPSVEFAKEIMTDEMPIQKLAKM